MKAIKLLLLLLLGAAIYETYEYAVGRGPLEQLAGLFKPRSPKPADAPAAAPAPEAGKAAPPGDTPLVLSAPPRESPESGEKRFGPFAEYLSGAIGRKVVYKHPITWGGYQSDMQAGAYDLVFDGPHFVSWRMERLGHNVLVKLPGEFLYVGFVRKDGANIRTIQQLAGHTVCVHAPPNLGTLMLLTAFDKTVREPQIVITEGYKEIYQGVMDGKCVGAMLPKNHLAKYEKDGARMRVIYSHPPYPQQALTAGPRLSAEEHTKITDALLVSAAQTALSDFRDAYALSGWFTRARNEEYAGLSAYLRLVQGFY